MACSTEVNHWVTKVHGLSKAMINSKSSETGFVSVQDLVGEANAAYTMLLTANCWGPTGETDSGSALDVLACTKTEINNLIKSKCPLCSNSATILKMALPPQISEPATSVCVPNISNMIAHKTRPALGHGNPRCPKPHGKPFR